jgi:hypothetical protein
VGAIILSADARNAKITYTNSDILKLIAFKK